MNKDKALPYVIGLIVIVIIGIVVLAQRSKVIETGQPHQTPSAEPTSIR